MVKRLKCWRKEKWDKEGRWQNPKKHKSISIRGSFGGTPYRIILDKDTRRWGGGNTIKVVKTKIQAKRFAKSYMRKHDVCRR